MAKLNGLVRLELATPRAQDLTDLPDGSLAYVSFAGMTIPTAQVADLLERQPDLEVRFVLCGHPIEARNTTSLHFSSELYVEYRGRDDESFACDKKSLSFR